MTRHFAGLNQCLSLFVVAGTVVFTLSSTSYAFPGLGANCAQCHATTAGNVDVSPDPLSLLVGENGEITFDVTELAAGATDAALAVRGLTDPDLQATIVNSGDWTPRTDPNTSEQYFTRALTAPGTHSLQISTASTAVPGDYDLSVLLAGNGAWSTMADFVISTAVIPEPSTVALLSVVGGTLGFAWIGRRRQKRN